MLDLTKEFLQTLNERIDAGKDSEVRATLVELHATDIAEVIDRLDFDHASYVYRLLDNETKADVLIELDEEQRSDLLNAMTAEEIAEEVLENLDSDDAADVMGELPETKAEEVIGLLEDKEQASDIRDLLNYADGTAGALMAKELVKVHGEWTVTRAIREIRRQADELHQVYTVYVVDAEDRLTGRLSLKHLLLAAESTRSRISELQSQGDIVTILAEEPEKRQPCSWNATILWPCPWSMKQDAFSDALPLMMPSMPSSKTPNATTSSPVVSPRTLSRATACGH
jgi:magnesium transporter